MNKFKLEDFRVGDTVTLVGIVKSIDLEATLWPLEISYSDGAGDWVRLSSVAARERNIRVGDRVKDATIDGSPATVLAVDGDELWLKDDDGDRWTDNAKDFEIVS